VPPFLDESELEDTESRDRFLRQKVDQFLNNSKSGKAIDIVVALLSLFTSLAFILLTYFDLRYLNPCCKTALENYAAYVAKV